MEFKIKKEIVEKRIETPTYKLSIEFMFGDADGEETVDVMFDAEDEDEIASMKALILAIEICMVAYPSGRGGGGSDEFNHIPEYLAFFSEEPEEYLDESGATLEEINAINPWDLHVDHPYDVMCDCQSDFTSYSLEFLDGMGGTFEVEVSLSEEDKLKIKR